MIIFFFLHEDIKETVNDINYSAAEAISTTGILNDIEYRCLKDSLSKFGDYKITLKVEKQLKQGVYDTYYDTDTEIDSAFKTSDYTKVDILNKHLQLGDRLTILLEDRNPTVFGRLINSSVFVWKPEKTIDINIRSLKTATIGSRNKNLRSGYDVAVEIKKAAADISMAVYVVTKLNKAGKYYGSDTHDYVDITNLYYGDEADERSGGVNNILENGSFLSEVEFYSSGKVKLIKYIQQ
jgi:hypothetical protein